MLPTWGTEMIAKVNVMSALRLPAGEHLDGVVLAEPTWAREGEHSIGADAARAFEASGYLEILSVDGKTAVWDACCAGAHDPA